MRVSGRVKVRQDGHHRHEVTDEVAAGVAEKRGGAGVVVGEKTEQGTGGGQTEDGHQIFTTHETLRDVAKALEAKYGEARKAAMIWKPQNTVMLSDEAGEKMMKLMQALDDDDDVQNVFANFEVSDALMQKMGE